MSKVKETPKAVPGRYIIFFYQRGFPTEKNILSWRVVVVEGQGGIFP